MHLSRLNELLFKTLVAESDKRSEREDKWVEMEREAMYRTACEYADRHGLARPTIKDVERAEQSACGHVDYAAKFAFRLADAVISKTDEDLRTT